MASNNRGDVELVISAKNEATQTLNELLATLQSFDSEAGGSGIAGFFKKLTSISRDLGEQQDELTDAFNRTKQAQDQLQKASADRDRDLQSQRDAIDKTEQSLSQLNAKYDQYAAAASQARQPSEALAKTLEKQQARQAELATTVEQAGERIRAAQAEFDQNQGVDEKATQSIANRKAKVIELGQAWRDITATVASAQNALSQLATQRDTADTGQKQAQTRLNTLRAEVKEAEKYEKEKRRIVRESKEATDEEVQSRDKAVAATKRLRAAVADQLLVEREARSARNAANKSYQDQVKEVGKLTTAAERQKKTYTDLKGSLAAFTAEQEKSSTERQRANIEKLNKSLEKLKNQYESASARASATQGRVDSASGPDPKEVARFETLKQKINETQQEIVEQTRALDKLNREYDDAGVAASDLARKQSDLEDVTNRLADQQSRLDREAGQAADSINRAGNESAQAGLQFKLWGDSSRQTLSFLQRIRGELLSIAAAYAGVYAVGGAIRSIYDASILTQKAVARLSAKFDGDMVAVGENMKFVRGEADRLGLSYETLLDQYTSFVNNVPDGKLSLEQIQFTFSGIATASRAAGLGSEDVKAVFVALGQIASKGAVSLEELRQQLGERIPAAVETMAEGLSNATGELITTEELLARINKGEVSSTAIVAFADALVQKFGPGLEEALKSALPPLERFKNAVYDLRMEVADSGFIEELIKGLNAVNKEVSKPEFKDGMREFGQALSGVAKFTVTLIQNLDTIISVMKAIIAVKLVGWLGSVATQIWVLNGASVGWIAQMRLARTNVIRLQLAIQGLFRLLLVLPAAFFAGFAIGDYLQKNFAPVRKFGVLLVETYVVSITKIKGAWDVFLLQMKGGFKSTIKEIAKAFLTIIPAVIWNAIGVVGAAIGLVNKQVGDAITEFAVNSLAEVEAAADDLMSSLIDTQSIDRAVAETRRLTKAKLEADSAIFEQMRKDIDKSVEASEPEKTGESDATKYSDAFREKMLDLDYFQTGVNAGKSVGEGLISQLKNIRNSLAEESIVNIEGRLKYIRSEFKDFMDDIGSYNANSDEAISDIRKVAAEQIAEINKNSGVTDAVKNREISLIQKRAEQEIAKIRKDQASLSGARQAAEQLIAIRQQQAIQEQQDKDVEAAQKRINDLVADRKDEMTRVNDLADLNLITTEEQGRRLNKINDESIVKIKQALVEAKKLADETGNASLAKFASGFDDFEQIERRRAAVENLQRVEQDINEVLDRRNTQIETINALRDSGNKSDAQAREDIKTILNDTNPVLKQMVQDGLALARALKDPGMIATFESLAAQLERTNDKLFDGKQMAEDFASGFTNAFNAFIDGTKSAGDAFRQFAADFLRQIANMILQQAIFNAVKGIMGGAAGGLNGVTAGIQHTGGIAGRTGSSRKVSPAWFTNAVKYHSGGVAGLKPNEVPTILERGEEVLTRQDPRHQYNQGSGNQQTSVKIVNAIDSSSIVSEGLNSAQGQKAIINFIRANKSQVKAVLQ